MVKNLPTVERSTKIRFGKNCTNNQAENTIVFNASEGEIDTPFTDSVYITPLRLRTDLSDRNISVLAYNQVTKEMMDSGAVAEDILNFTLEAAVINGNVTSNIMWSPPPQHFRMLAFPIVHPRIHFLLVPKCL